jgi:hypothetical protein
MPVQKQIWMDMHARYPDLEARKETFDRVIVSHHFMMAR